jgi:Cu/Ag efflux protein CusF
MTRELKSDTPGLVPFLLCALLTLSAACNRGPSQARRHNLLNNQALSPQGKVISIDPQAATASINNEPIPNFMGPMAMPYPIKPPAALAQLQPGDTIAAEVVVQPDNIYWLENVKVTAHSSAPADKHTAEKDRRSK